MTQGEAILTQKSAIGMPMTVNATKMEQITLNIMYAKRKGRRSVYVPYTKIPKTKNATAMKVRPTPIPIDPETSRKDSDQEVTFD